MVILPRIELYHRTLFTMVLVDIAARFAYGQNHMQSRHHHGHHHHHGESMPADCYGLT
jgi:hypothetical protein